MPVQESRQLFPTLLSAIPKDRMISYRFGNGSREVFLFSAYDCPTCRTVETELQKQGSSLNATIYIVPTALNYSGDPMGKALIKGVLCSENRAAAWRELLTKKQPPKNSGTCVENPDDYAFLSRSFPVKFPATVPTAVTSDGTIYPMVLARFNDVFRGH